MFFPSILSPFTTHMKLGICSVNQFPFRHGVPLAESDIFNGLKVLSSSQFTRFFYLPRHRYDWTALFKLGHRPPWTWMEENELEWITGGLSCIFSDLPVLPSKWSSKSVCRVQGKHPPSMSGSFFKTFSALKRLASPGQRIQRNFGIVPAPASINYSLCRSSYSMTMSRSSSMTNTVETAYKYAICPRGNLL